MPKWWLVMGIMVYVDAYSYRYTGNYNPSSYSHSKLSSRRAVHRATTRTATEPSSRRVYSSRNKRTNSKCNNSTPGPRGPQGPAGPAGAPGQCHAEQCERRSDGVSVGFFVALSDSTFGMLESVVTFDTILTNRGNAFDINTSVFTAPKSGLYQFAATGIQSSKEFPLTFSIMRGFLTTQDDYVCTASSPDQSYQSTSCQAVLELEPGQQVYVKLIKGDLFASRMHHTSFSGYRVN